ncbi:MAG: tail fiber domain-containing protein, partial [Chitinophagaceae bacterium]|nr:tail fiber domain-containing protein [Chitinophagaceae bacterium]
YSTRSNKIWFYNGSNWQQLMSNAGGMDSIWYTNKDSIAYTKMRYVGINRDLSLSPAQANLEVNGSLLVQSKMLYTGTSPTVAQTFTLPNSDSRLLLGNDSVFRVLDPGGTAFYGANMRSHAASFTVDKANQVGWKLSFAQNDFGLGTGDTLWVATNQDARLNDSYSFFLTNSNVVPREMILPAMSGIYLWFKSDNTNSNRGFDITIRRLYGRDEPQQINTAGNALRFSNGSFSAGTNVESKGSRSVALGESSIASGDNSSAIGLMNEAQGNGSIAMGSGNVSVGRESISFGSYNHSKSASSTAIGYNNRAIGSYSVALGTATTVKSYAGLALGYYNDTSDNPTVSTGALDRIFQLGNGHANVRRNALTILRNGNVGIGVLEPESLLHLPNTAVNRKIVLYQTIPNSDLDYFGFGINFAILRYNVPFGNYHVFYGGSNAVFSISSIGNANLSGTLTQNSDARLKKDIVPISNVLGRITKLNGYRYKWKDAQRSQQAQIGLLAQEVLVQFPELVETDMQNNLSVNYSGLAPLLIESIKELQQQLKEQQLQIDALKKKNSKSLR